MARLLAEKAGIPYATAKQIVTEAYAADKRGIDTTLDQQTGPQFEGALIEVEVVDGGLGRVLTYGLGSTPIQVRMLDTDEGWDEHAYTRLTDGRDAHVVPFLSEPAVAPLAGPVTGMPDPAAPPQVGADQDRSTLTEENAEDGTSTFYGECPSCAGRRPGAVNGAGDSFLPGSVCPECGHVEGVYQVDATDLYQWELEQDGTVRVRDDWGNTVDVATLAGDEDDWENIASVLGVQRHLVISAVRLLDGE
jgi:hypothetical protein